MASDNREEPAYGWTAFEHTADVGLHVRARDMRELLVIAAEAMAAQMFETSGVAETATHSFRVEGEEPEELLVAWLGELLFAFEAEGFVTARAEVRRLDSKSAEGVLVGERYDARRHVRLAALKAVTYHDLQISETDAGLEVSVVLDA